MSDFQRWPGIASAERVGWLVASCSDIGVSLGEKLGAGVWFESVAFSEGPLQLMCFFWQSVSPGYFAIPAS